MFKMNFNDTKSTIDSIYVLKMLAEDLYIVQRIHLLFIDLRNALDGIK